MVQRYELDLKLELKLDLKSKTSLLLEQKGRSKNSGD